MQRKRKGGRFRPHVDHADAWPITAPGTPCANPRSTTIAESQPLKRSRFAPTKDCGNQASPIVDVAFPPRNPAPTLRNLNLTFAPSSFGIGPGRRCLVNAFDRPPYARCSAKHPDTCMLPRTFVVPPSSDQQPSCPTSRKPSAARSTVALHQVFATRAAGRNFNFFRAQFMQMVWRRTTCEYNSGRANVDETHPLFCRRANELVGAIANPCLATASNCDGRSKKPKATSSSA
jgi:hypothetical protein